MAWKCLRTTDSRVGSSTFSSSTGSESAPGAFQFTIARTSCSVPPYVGSASSDISSPILRPRSGWWRRRCLAPQLYSSMMDGWSGRDLVLSRLPKNLSHRRRMPPLSRNKLPISSLMACYPFAFLPPRPTVLFRCLYGPLVS